MRKSKLADDLNQVIFLDEPDFSTPEDPPKEPSSDANAVVSPPSEPKSRTFPPPLPRQLSLRALAFPPFNLWSQSREATVVPMPQSKAMAMDKVSKRMRDLLTSTTHPTSGDEMPPPAVPLEPFLRPSAKNKTALKRKPFSSSQQEQRSEGVLRDHDLMEEWLSSTRGLSILFPLWVARLQRRHPTRSPWQRWKRLVRMCCLSSPTGSGSRPSHDV